MRLLSPLAILTSGLTHIATEEVKPVAPNLFKLYDESSGEKLSAPPTKLLVGTAELP